MKQFVQPCGTRHSGVRLENETQKTLEYVEKTTFDYTSWVKDDSVTGRVDFDPERYLAHCLATRYLQQNR